MPEIGLRTASKGRLLSTSRQWLGKLTWIAGVEVELRGEPGLNVVVVARPPVVRGLGRHEGEVAIVELEVRLVGERPG